MKKIRAAQKLSPKTSFLDHNDQKIYKFVQKSIESCHRKHPFPVPKFVNPDMFVLKRRSFSCDFSESNTNHRFIGGTWFFWLRILPKFRRFSRISTVTSGPLVMDPVVEVPDLEGMKEGMLVGWLTTQWKTLRENMSLKNPVNKALFGILGIKGLRSAWTHFDMSVSYKF